MSLFHCVDKFCSVQLLQGQFWCCEDILADPHKVCFRGLRLSFRVRVIIRLWLGAGECIRDDILKDGVMFGTCISLEEHII